MIATLRYGRCACVHSIVDLFKFDQLNSIKAIYGILYTLYRRIGNALIISGIENVEKEESFVFRGYPTGRKRKSAHEAYESR